MYKRNKNNWPPVAPVSPVPPKKTWGIRVTLAACSDFWPLTIDFWHLESEIWLLHFLAVLLLFVIFVAQNFKVLWQRRQ